MITHNKTLEGVNLWFVWFNHNVGKTSTTFWKYLSFVIYGSTLCRSSSKNQCSATYFPTMNQWDWLQWPSFSGYASGVNFKYVLSHYHGCYTSFSFFSKLCVNFLTRIPLATYLFLASVFKKHHLYNKTYKNKLKCKVASDEDYNNYYRRYPALCF